MICSVDAFIEAHCCFEGTRGFHQSGALECFALGRGKEHGTRNPCCCERRGCSSQVGAFIEASGSFGVAARSARFKGRLVGFTLRRRLSERLKMARRSEARAPLWGFSSILSSPTLCRSGAHLDGPYNIRLHLTATRELRSLAVRGEPQRVRLHSGFSVHNRQRWFIGVFAPSRADVRRRR